MMIILVLILMTLFILLFLLFVILIRKYFFVRESYDWYIYTLKSKLNLYKQWIEKNKDKNSLEQSLNNMKVKTVAIYGYGDVGKSIVNTLEDSQIQVLYGVDQRAGCLDSEIVLFRPEDELEDVDLMIVTPIINNNEKERVINSLNKKISGKIITAEKLLFEL